MTIPHMLSHLFNLNAHTDFLNSAGAARDFWEIAGVIVVAVVAISLIRSNRHRAHG